MRHREGRGMKGRKRERDERGMDGKGR